MQLRELPRVDVNSGPRAKVGMRCSFGMGIYKMSMTTSGLLFFPVQILRE
jgi:hypothetical protein